MQFDPWLNAISNFPFQSSFDEEINILQLEAWEIPLALQLLEKIDPTEKAALIQCVMTLKEMQLSDWGNPVTTLQLLETVVTKIESTAKRVEMTQAIDNLFKSGVSGSNECEVLTLLIEASNQGKLEEVISLGNRFFNSGRCVERLKAAFEELKSGLIRECLCKVSSEEARQAEELLKDKVQPLQFGKALSLTLTLPLAERQGIVDLANTLLKINMRDAGDDGYLMVFFTALEMLAKVPDPSKREKITIQILDLFKLGVPGAEESSVLEFLIETPEDVVNLILPIAKKAFFNYRNIEKNSEILKGTYIDEKMLRMPYGTFNGHCLGILEGISRICKDRPLSLEQLKAFENLKIAKELESYKEEERILYKILFGDQDVIRPIAFEFVRGKYHLFRWMEKLVNNTTMQPLFEQWVSENPKTIEYNQSCMNLMGLNQKIRQLDFNKTAKSFIYSPNFDKLFPKNLVARQNPVSKDNLEKVKKVIKCFLDVNFDSKEVKTIEKIPASSEYCIFELENDKYWINDYGSSVIKNGEKCVAFDMEDWGILNQNLLSYILKGNRFEKVSVEPTDWFKRSQVTDDYWSKWESHGSDSAAVYEKQIHPMICRAVYTILKSQKWQAPPVILDVGGGSGRLADSILRMGKLNYTLLEKNEEELECAKTLLGEKAAIIPTDIVKDSFQVQPCSVDIAIASGVLTHRVLKDREEALIILKKISSCIKSGGFILLAGLAKSHITAVDLKGEGFEVINTGLPQTLESFYIARKV